MKHTGVTVAALEVLKEFTHDDGWLEVVGGEAVKLLLDGGLCVGFISCFFMVHSSCNAEGLVV